MTDNDNFSMLCFESDDWEPTPEELDNMFITLDSGKQLQLEWSCPGRRPPTPTEKHEAVTQETKKEP